MNKVLVVLKFIFITPFFNKNKNITYIAKLVVITFLNSLGYKNIIKKFTFFI